QRGLKSTGNTGLLQTFPKGRAAEQATANQQCRNITAGVASDAFRQIFYDISVFSYPGICR
ncbi:hypothetical protein, partial [Pseudomonas sp.]|uniref:hypothetical protein n=1 Tax=Pseudomonas sp. TaxID=306 RepID=UPI0028A67691